MYDFYFGTKDEISKQETKYLVSIKRMMPRWINSIPETEFLLLAKLLDEKCKNLPDDYRPVFVETGAGASSLLFIFYSMKYNGLSFSWDINSEKGSLIKSITYDTIGKYFQKSVDNYWKFISADSLSPYLGLTILNELVDNVDVFFHDAEHVWSTIKEELSCVMQNMPDGSVIALDDANLSFQNINEGYIKIFRKKWVCRR